MQLTYEIVSKLIRADFETGKLFWLPRPVEMFASEAAVKRWNARYAGKEACTAERNGYRVGKLNCKNYSAHRVLWLLATGHWPVNEIDHVNGVRSDNRLINLRDVTGSENGKNQRVRTNNSSGVLGVDWHKRDKKWRAAISINGKKNHLGLFDDFDAAVSARKAAEAEYGFHPNHGRAV